MYLSVKLYLSNILTYTFFNEVSQRWLDYFEQFAGCRSVVLHSGYAAA